MKYYLDTIKLIHFMICAKKSREIQLKSIYPFKIHPLTTTVFLYKYSYRLHCIHYPYARWARMLSVLLTARIITPKILQMSRHTNKKTKVKSSSRLSFAARILY
jgi:hypothetical protein